MPSKTIYQRCLPGGPWRRLLPGVILMSRAEPTLDQRVAAALLFSGPQALITAVEACRRHGLRSGALPAYAGMHVLVPHEHKLQSSEFLTVERTIYLPEEVKKDGVPLAPLVRATTDAVRRMRATEPVAALLIEAIQRGRCSPKALVRELNTGSRRGTAIPRRILAEVQELRSVAEVRALDLSKNMRTPPTHWNTNIYGPDGEYIGCPDAWWDDIALAWEIDSLDFHFYRAEYARTQERNARYAIAGVTVVPTLPTELRDNPEAVLRKLEAAYLTAAARPRPQVYFASCP